MFETPGVKIKGNFYKSKNALAGGREWEGDKSAPFPLPHLMAITKSEA